MIPATAVANPIQVLHLAGVLLAHIAQVQAEHRPGVDPLAAHFRQALQEVDVQTRRGEIARQTIFRLDERHLFRQTTTSGELGVAHLRVDLFIGLCDVLGEPHPASEDLSGATYTIELP